MSDDKMSRREFLRRLGLSAAGFVAGSWAGGRAGLPDHTITDTHPISRLLPQPPRAEAQVAGPRVAVIRHSDIMTDDLTPVREVAIKVLDEGVKYVFGTQTPEAAWPNVAGPEDSVCIKVNCFGAPRVYTHPIIAHAVADRLHQHCGVPLESIVIWDRLSAELERGGYTINRDGPGVRCYGTDGEYSVERYGSGEYARTLSNILLDADVLVNLPVLKAHGMSGVTMALKNHYGSIGTVGEELHRNYCDPGIAQLNAVAPIRDKTRLVVADATSGTVGRAHARDLDAHFVYHGLMLYTDPVAGDSVARQIIDDQRINKGLPSLEQEGWLPRHLATAASMGLGTDNLDTIQVWDHDLT